MTEFRLPAILAATALFTAFFAVPAAAEIYKWVDDKGVLHYTTTPPARESQGVEVMQEHYPERAPAGDRESSSIQPVHAPPGPSSVAPAPGRPRQIPGAAVTPSTPAGASSAPAESEQKPKEPPPPRDSEGNRFPAESFDRRR
jgi:hypothetical protein